MLCHILAASFKKRDLSVIKHYFTRGISFLRLMPRRYIALRTSCLLPKTFNAPHSTRPDEPYQQRPDFSLRKAMVTGLFERKAEYRITLVACLFYERVAPYVD